MMLNSNSDVFLCHNSNDKPVVEEIARRLLGKGIIPWLDKWNLIPGEPWQEAIEAALHACSSCAIFIGADGASPWQNEEMYSAISRRVKDPEKAFRVFPVFLPNTPKAEFNALPPFLHRHTGVYFKDSLDDEDAFNLLISGIQGTKPGPHLTSLVRGNVSPYKGLQVFDVDDHNFFFGRDALLGLMMNKIRLCVDKDSVRFLGIIGSSGSGKSSLARAGIMGTLKYEKDEICEWVTVICCPGADPLENLAISLMDMLGFSNDVRAINNFVDALKQNTNALNLSVKLTFRNNSSSKYCVILIDQFEEIFTLCDDEVQRKAFIDNLIYAATVINGRSVVLFAIRADYYGRCAAYTELASVLSTHQFLVDRMSINDMKNAIEQPASLLGYKFDDGLIQVLVDDASTEAGALPLLQHALLELWEKRENQTLTYKAYFNIGGLHGALERRAEKIYDGFSEAEKLLCQKILLKLIRLNEASEATKRRTNLKELIPLDHSPDAIEDILAKLSSANSRLITVSLAERANEEVVIELSHEALIRNWSRLANWIEDSKQSLLIQQRLIIATTEWLDNSRDTGLLLHGIRLTQIHEWFQAHAEEANDNEKSFLMESIYQADEEARSKDSSVLDLLEESAPGIWQKLSEMTEWSERCKKLFSSLANHKSLLEKYRYERGGKFIGGEKQAWVFKDRERQFQHDTLLTLINKTERFRDSLWISAEHVIHTMSDLEQLTVRDHLDEWQHSINCICNINKFPQYKGLKISPQIGLIPLGQNRQSGLFEFLHLLTGTLSEKDENGNFLISESSGVILILIPPGHFTMGAIKPSKRHPLGSPNIDRYAHEDESPMHTVELKPFFISKYQITQGQWLRATGYNPSMFRPETAKGANLCHPVECVSWHECINSIQPLGLDLPSEAQWEYAARANTSNMWWLGNEEEIIKDSACLEQVTHLPVGHFNYPNPFGLFDVIGNVWEWCADWYGSYTNAINTETSIRNIDNAIHKVSRGGSFFNSASFARSSIRYYHTPPEAKFNNRGLRPIKQLIT